MNCPRHGQVISFGGCPLCHADRRVVSASRGLTVDDRVAAMEWDDDREGHRTRRRHVEPSRDDEQP